LPEGREARGTFWELSQSHGNKLLRACSEWAFLQVFAVVAGNHSFPEDRRKALAELFSVSEGPAGSDLLGHSAEDAPSRFLRRGVLSLLETLGTSLLQRHCELLAGGCGGYRPSDGDSVNGQ